MFKPQPKYYSMIWYNIIYWSILCGSLSETIRITKNMLNEYSGITKLTTFQNAKRSTVTGPLKLYRCTRWLNYFYEYIYTYWKTYYYRRITRYIISYHDCTILMVCLKNIRRVSLIYQKVPNKLLFNINQISNGGTSIIAIDVIISKNRMYIRKYFKFNNIHLNI